MNSWAALLWTFWEKWSRCSAAVLSIRADLVHLQPGDITNAPLHIQSHFRTHFEQRRLKPPPPPPPLPPPPAPSALYPARPQSHCGFTPGNLEMKKRRISSSKFRVQGWNGFFFFLFILFPFPRITSDCQIPHYAKLFQEPGTCTWWINQHIPPPEKSRRKSAGIVNCYIHVWLSEGVGDNVSLPVVLFSAPQEWTEITAEKKQTFNHFCACTQKNLNEEIKAK